MPSPKSILTAETFRFLRDLKRNNRKEWMDENRERYRHQLVDPLRELLVAMTPATLKLHPRIDVSGRTAVNFSRINRDIRFAKDKTLYHARMYLFFPPQGGKNRAPGQFYIGVNPDTVTTGFRIYLDPKAKASALSSRILRLPAWSTQQKRRLARKYESYWYSMEKGAWTKNEGWPTTPEQWRKLKAWIVRRKMKPAAALRPAFPTEAAKDFRNLLPIYRFMSLGG
jgi:uncharacterized protein (TIGR02453 family)